MMGYGSAQPAESRAPGSFEQETDLCEKKLKEVNLSRAVGLEWHWKENVPFRYPEK